MGPIHNIRDLAEVGLIGRSPAMMPVFDAIRRLAEHRATVLIGGESGTGKGVVARAIHACSDRAESPFVTVDCTSIPGGLVESELFGHEPGAYTDARTRKVGLLELAGDGTVFLDEIGLLPVDVQAKLLGVLETRRCRRVGGTEEIEFSARFIAATNEDLERAMSEGRFREDLFYRLDVASLHLPTLHERGDDVQLLASQLLERYVAIHHAEPRVLAEDARALLQAYAWPGNVRELANVMERAVLMTDATVVRAGDLIVNRRRSARGLPPGEAERRAAEASLLAASKPPAVTPALPPPNVVLTTDSAGGWQVNLPPEGLDLEQLRSRYCVPLSTERTATAARRPAC